MQKQIDVVLLGVNVEQTLEACLKSILQSSFQGIRVFYVDGGSTDSSLEIARRFPQVAIIERQLAHPSPGLQRNLGWRAGSAPFVHFLDSDTIVDPHWFWKAVAAMQGGVGAVRGNRREKYPEASVFNWIADQEWNVKPGECGDFGGDVLIRREALEVTGGYDEMLIGGEDPELAQRIRQAGWKIIQLDEPMTLHDLAMKTVRQYLKRAYRTGYGYAAVFMRHFGKSQGFWLTEIRRILMRAGGFLVFSSLGLGGFFWSPPALLFLLPALLLLLFPRIFRVSYFAQAKDLSHQDAKTYAWNCSLVVLPQFFGIIRFLVGKFFNRPLKNKRLKMKTGKF